MTDPIKRDDALPAVTAKPLDKFGVRELARASGISPTTAMRVKRGEGDLDGSTLRAVLAATGTCLCCGNSALTPNPVADSKTANPVVNDPAAIREAALREAAARIGGMIRGSDETEYEEGYNDALATAERHILALIGEKKLLTKN